MKFSKIAISIILFFSVCYIILLLNKFWQGEFYAVDNVFFDTAIWKVSQFQAPIVRHFLLGEINILGDHFHPTIFLMSPLYWFSSSQSIVLLGMVLAYSLSAVVLMKIGYRLIAHRMITNILLGSYFLYIGTQNAFLYGFHELNLMPLFFSLVFYALVFNKKKLFWISIILLLLTKETMAPIVIGIGIFIFFWYPEKRKTAIFLIIFSILYFLIVTRVVIPFFSGRFIYQQISHPNSIGEAISQYFNPIEKREVIFKTFSSFGFLPIFNLFFLPIILQDFLIRFLFSPNWVTQYTINYHYNIVLAPMMFLSFVYLAAKLQKSIIGKIIIFVSLAFGLIFSFILFKNSPLRLVFNPAFYKQTEKSSEMRKFVKKVPLKGKIMAPNNLAYYFSHQEVYLYVKNEKEFNKISPDVVIFDLSKGQFPKNFAPLTKKEVEMLILRFKENSKYRLSYKENDRYIFLKK
jgi:uncharacterized membrane protein